MCIAPKLKYTLFSCKKETKLKKELFLSFLNKSQKGILIHCESYKEIKIVYEIIQMKELYQEFKKKIVLVDITYIEQSVRVGILLYKIICYIKKLNFFKGFHMVGYEQDIIDLPYDFIELHEFFNPSAISLHSNNIDNKTPIQFQRQFDNIFYPHSIMIHHFL